MNSSNSLQRSIGVAVLTASLMLVLVLAGASSSTAARDRQLPRIVAAAMQDVDRDSRTDRVRITYPSVSGTPPTGTASYPFRIAGYRIRSVGQGGARKTIVLTLVERKGSRGPGGEAVRPLQPPTRSRPVKDRAGNQAVAQLFRAVRDHTAAKPAAAPAPSAPGDRQWTATASLDAQDRGPDNSAIKPGAPDAPDLDFVDSNCDGIDGDEPAGDLRLAAREGHQTRARRRRHKREIRRGRRGCGREEQVRPRSGRKL